MNDGIKKTIRKSKNVIFFALGIFFIIGSIALIQEDIGGTVFFGAIGIIFLIKSKVIIKGLSKKNEQRQNVTEELAQSLEEQPDKNIVDNFFNRGKINKRIYNYIKDMQQNNEDIVAMVTGNYKNKKMYLLTTNRRVVIFNKSWLNSTQIEIPIEKINSIGQSKGVIFGEIHIWDGSSKIVINNIPKKQIAKFVRATNEQMNNYKSFKIEINKTVEKDVTDKIEKLATLHKEGELTDYEFAMKKMELLEKLKK